MVDTKKSKDKQKSTVQITSFDFVGKVARMGAKRLYVAFPSKKLEETGLQETLHDKLVKVRVEVVS